jgi:hypothetical protein
VADNFVAWPAVTNDDGSLTTGTPFSAELIADIRASIADNVYSPANPAVKTCDIIDEVIAARGVSVSVDARLDTMDSLIGGGGVSAVGRQDNASNFVRNRFMDRWSDGAAAAPDYYTLVGAGATIAKAGSGLGDPTQVGAGKFCAKVTSTAGASAELRQMVIAASDFSNFYALRGRTIVFAVRFQADAVDRMRLVVTDGVGTATTPYNTTTTGTLATLVGLSAAATYLQVSVEVKAGGAGYSEYVGAYSVTIGDVVSSDAPFCPGPMQVDPSRSELPRLLDRQLANIDSATGAESGYLYPMPPDTLSEVGQQLEIVSAGAFANNANNKKLKLYVGTNFLDVIVDNAAIANNKWTLRGTISRVSSSQVVFDGVVTFHAASGAPPTVWHLSAVLAGGATDLTAAQDVKLYMLAPTTNADISIARTSLRFWP